jgi:ABC-2 type transport system permease protein
MESDPATAGMDLSALITQPTAFDSWAQFFASNVGQLGMVILVIVFSGMISSELSRGTLTIMLSKGLSRSAVVLSKFTSACLIWTVCYVISFFTAWGYTLYMFPGENVPNLFLAAFAMWVFGIFLLALTTLFAALTSKGYACMLLTGAVFIVLMLLNIIPRSEKYNPVSLSDSPTLLIADIITPSHIYPTLIAAALAIFALVFFAIIIFKSFRKRHVR